MTSRIVSREQWIEERIALLQKEKEFTRQRDAISAERRGLPWVRIEKEYVFDTPQGKATLAGLFQGRSQLFIKHFMMGPGQQGQCVGCSLEVDHLTGLLPHLENHDVTYTVVARAPLDEIEAVRQRMDWKFPWVSSYGSDFNFDFHVSFTEADMRSGRAFYNFTHTSLRIQDLSGDSVFFKDSDGQIYLTYQTFSRGGEQFLGIYGYLDVMPKGRNEPGPYFSLADWARPRNAYDAQGMVEANGRYHKPGCGCSAHQDQLAS